MRLKQKIGETYPENPIHIDGPSYAEELELIIKYNDQLKPSIASDENWIRRIISGKLQIPIEIVHEYLCFGDYISRSVLKTLAESKMDKHFFERAQKVKRILVKNYRHDELPYQ
jgi:hypothetical protein